MAITDTIESMKTHLGEAYASLDEKGATIPENKNLENLSESILSISGGGGDISEYFQDVEIGNTSSSQSGGYTWANVIKKVPYKFKLRSTGNSALMYTFAYCPLEKIELDAVSFSRSGMINLSYAFYNCPNVKYLDLSMIDTSKVHAYNYMFSNCKNLESIIININEFDTTSTVNMAGMFDGCNSLKAVPEGFCFFKSKSTSPNVSATGMFKSCSSIENFKIDRDDLDTSWVTSFSQFLAYCTNLKSVDLSNFNFTGLSNSTSGGFQYFLDMGSDYARNLTSVKFPTEKQTSKLVTIYYMFRGCNALTEIDLSFLEATLTNVSYAFYNCRALTKIDIRNITLSGITGSSYYSNMLTGVPTDCLIIVKNQTQKNWFNSKFPTYTNVKTVDELGE